MYIGINIGFEICIEEFYLIITALLRLTHKNVINTQQRNISIEEAHLNARRINYYCECTLFLYLIQFNQNPFHRKLN